MKKENLCGLTCVEIMKITGEELPGKHALTIANSIYKKGAKSIKDITGIPKKTRLLLHENAEIEIAAPFASEVSADGSVKYLFNSKGKRFESVFLPEKKRNTVCVSSQSGCRMGCPFCVTGKYGFHGNLTTAEIVSQVVALPEASGITHVVFMGMGEPMDNLDNVLKACEILTAEWGRALGRKHITVSTVGITPGIKRFLDESQCNLTLSLFSPFPEERRSILPAERKYPVNEIIEYLKRFTLVKKRRISLAYVMIAGINDSEDHLGSLKVLLAGSGIRVNLLPYHPSPNDANRSCSEERMNYFKHNLVISGISASVRKSRGSDISAACGLLASDYPF
jgi:23S rRNA (adenine2503-C2)-methyltransferase